MEKVRYCQKCGALRKDDHYFCSVCGGQLQVIVVNTPNQEDDDNNEYGYDGSAPVVRPLPKSATPPAPVEAQPHDVQTPGPGEAEAMAEQKSLPVVAVLVDDRPRAPIELRRVEIDGFRQAPSPAPKAIPEKQKRPEKFWESYERMLWSLAAALVIVGVAGNAINRTTNQTSVSVWAGIVLTILLAALIAVLTAARRVRSTLAALILIVGLALWGMSMFASVNVQVWQESGVACLGAGAVLLVWAWALHRKPAQ